MTARYLLNSPVLPDYGLYRFEGPLALEAVKRWLNEGFVSAIGHASTAAWLSTLLGQEIPMQRLTIHMAVGDEALVIKLKQRLPEGVVLDAAALNDIPYEFGLLQRIG